MSSQSSTPKGSTSLSQKSKNKVSRSTGDSSPRFTPRMQDAQARNKNPYASDSSDSAYEPFEGSKGRFDDYGGDSYEQIQQRREAAIVLDNPELLMMHAQSRNDSVPGTRYYFTKMLCGYLTEDDKYQVIDEPSQKESEKGKEKSKLGKGKGKESSGS